MCVVLATRGEGHGREGGGGGSLGGSLCGQHLSGFFLLCCACVLSHSVVLALCDPVDCKLLGCFSPWDSPRQNTGVGSHSSLQGTFPT